MKLLINIHLVIILSIAVLSAQFIADLETNSITKDFNNQTRTQNSLSLLDAERFDISHSFIMSMMSGKQGMLSIAGLSNNISYFAMDNLKIDANLTIYKSQMLIGNNNELDLSFDAGITYQPTKNSFLQLRFQNIPHYQKYQTRSPFNMGLIR
ncbi:MAG: hypothetical protein ACJZ12_04975 [Candidatus Neomarinimicrobiota bacterium]